jgi:serine/threonine-protein kinase
MKRYAPLITLLVGVLLAGVHLTASSIAARPAVGPERGTDEAALRPTAAPSATATAAPSVSPTRPAPRVNAVWAGEVDGGGVTVAISVKDGVAIAYLCDGRRIEAWLRGVAANGELYLTGRNGAELTGRFGNGGATGHVTTSGRTWEFTAPAVKKPSGVYRATAQVRNAAVDGGWIVLANGRQVGVLSVDGEPEPAPTLNTSTGVAIVDDTPITAEPVN